MIFSNQYLNNREMIISSAGAFATIAILSILANYIPWNGSSSLPILASMGASACLMFAVPHSPLAQPWPVFGGHLFSAAAGVFSSQIIINVSIAAATAVALSIVIMQIMHCLHPPSAATALIAVFGGTEIHTLGWQFCYEIVAFNVIIILVLAVSINNLIPGRRYPMNHSHHPGHIFHNKKTSQDYLRLDEQDFKWALKKMDGVIDVSEEDLVDLYEFAQEHARNK